jgi:integrase
MKAKRKPQGIPILEANGPKLPGRVDLSLKSSQPLRDIAQTILDTGLRPDEVFRIRVENIDFAARTIFNPFGKTKAARRTVTMTEAVWTALL